MDERNVVLIGFMGTGKSSVGRALAKKMKRPLVDLDQRIEQKEKRTIREIFEKDGEPYFRALEKEAVLEAASKTGQVITAGGGAVIDADNRRALKKNGILITLSASPETIHERVRRSGKRPLLKQGDNLLSEIKRLLSERRKYYAEADLFFDTDGRKPAEVAPVILKTLEKRQRKAVR